MAKAGPHGEFRKERDAVVVVVVLVVRRDDDF